MVLQEPYVELFSDSGREARDGEIQLPGAAENQGRKCSSAFVIHNVPRTQRIQYAVQSLHLRGFYTTVASALVLGVFLSVCGGSFFSQRLTFPVISIPPNSSAIKYSKGGFFFSL